MFVWSLTINKVLQHELPFSRLGHESQILFEIRGSLTNRIADLLLALLAPNKECLHKALFKETSNFY